MVYSVLYIIKRFCNLFVTCFNDFKTATCETPSSKAISRNGLPFSLYFFHLRLCVGVSSRMARLKYLTLSCSVIAAFHNKGISFVVLNIFTPREIPATVRASVQYNVQRLLPAARQAVMPVCSFYHCLYVYPFHYSCRAVIAYSLRLINRIRVSVRIILSRPSVFFGRCMPQLMSV